MRKNCLQHKSLTGKASLLPCNLRLALSLTFIICHFSFSAAQITIGGSVYGGGNAGDMTGSASVTIHAGDLNEVYGGARVANVGGSTCVNIDGEHASNYIIINKVYGGNDISGTIGESETLTRTVPFKPAINIDAEGTEGQEGYVPAKTIVDESYSAFVRITSKTNNDGTVAPDNRKIYIGQLFGGGNGGYTYSSSTTTADPADPDSPPTTTYTATTQSGGVAASSKTELAAPELAKAYIEVRGGSIVYAYGGGNNATVTEKTAIHVDNPSAVVNHILVNDAGEEANAAGYTAFENDGTLTGYDDLLTTERFRDKMGINTGFSYPSSGAYQIGSFYGGNNTAEMKIRPTWNLIGGKIRNIYSGGNRGRMTSPDGLLLQIAQNSTIEVDNVYGGCRMADVIPTKNGVEQYAEAITKDDFGNPLFFPGGMSARTRILGGHINNVYGGNDITGRVAGGNSIDVYTTVYGDIYGGGNGSYPYTDNPRLKDDPTYSDVYYDTSGYSSSVEALNAFRPAAEQVSIYMQGTEEKNTIVHGGIYLGGNSASLSSAREDPLVELKIGSYVIADKVFLGNNGEHMVETHEEESSGGVVTRREGVLRTMQSTSIASDGSKFNSIDLTNANNFAQYMDGVSMPLMPRVVFAKLSDGDPSDYIDYSSFFGSFYCGGNVGSMKIAGKTNIDFNHNVIIYNKLVGGCNSADVEAHEGFNAAYSGGFLGTDGESTGGLYGDGSGNIKDRLELNLSGLLVRPMRWKKKCYAGDDLIYTPTLGDGERWDTAEGYEYYVVNAQGQHVLEWNTVKYNTVVHTIAPVAPVTSGSGASTGKGSDDWNRRFDGGNIYGGCYTSGHVNGNVVININSTIHEPNLLFDEVDAMTSDDTATDKLYDIRDDYTISAYHTGVAMHTQGMDPLGQALNVFGGGKGASTEIWGSATINLNDGFTFQIFGGSEEGTIGKKSNIAYNGNAVDIADSTPDPRFSTYVNLNDHTKSGSATSSSDLAEAIFIYGGGFEGPIVGNSIVHLDNGRLFNSFAGSCNADILGHTETYVGLDGFPYVTDHIYGGNDLGGTICGTADFSSRVSADLPIATYGTSGDTPGKNVTQVSAYTEYVQGRVDYIFGGCYGDYDYSTDYLGYTAPRMDNAFVNFKSNSQAGNEVNKIFGAGQGAAEANLTAKNEMQDRSYVLIDIADESLFNSMEVFGAGQNCGVGMGVAKATADANADQVTAAAVIDLARGKIGAAYGGSLNEGVTRRTIVNVPGAVTGSETKTGSTIKLGSIFAGAYGSDIYLPCDVYEGTINYHSANALLLYDSSNSLMKGALYGGNNQKRRTLYGKINIDVPVREKHPTYGTTTATVYGAGCGANTWNEYTEVNLNAGAEVFEVYGGGEAGGVMSAESVETYIKSKPANDEQGTTMTDDKWRAAWTLGGSGYDSDLTDYAANTYASNTPTNLQNALAREAEMDDRTDTEGTKRYKRYNTNVIIHEGATVNNYAYGGGLGKADDTFISSGDVYGTTYIALLGGKVNKDLYAAGTNGTVYNYFNAGFTASANAYIKGGTARNVYGGGWAGAVGYHRGAISESYATDIPGETHVVIGDLDGTSFVSGIPAIERNAYGGGEGGAVFGTTHITLNRGYIGYRHFATKAAADADHTIFAGNIRNSTADATDIPAGIADGGGYYQEKLHDETWNGDGTGRLLDSGNIFGGGYIDNSYVDNTVVTMYGGHVRNALFGGGEIAAIGRGIITATGTDNSVRTLQGIYKAGHTSVQLYDGHVHRNVFGGGRGYNNLGEGGTLYTDGYIFGQTEVHVHGGEIGTEDGVAKGYGNVFGGGDIGYVYSAYELNRSLYRGKQSGIRYDNGDEGYYYKHNGTDFVDDNGNALTAGAEKIMTQDCMVLIEPHVKVMERTVLKDITQTADGKTTTLYAAGTAISTEQFNAIPEDVRSTLTEGTDWEKITSVTINSTVYTPGQYVTADQLNYLSNKNADAAWKKLDPAGIVIHNAVFAGGNTSSGSSKVYANATSIYGNASASVNDVYHRDLITLGTNHVGGIYGDGNLTFVDGYRELNITNYGTDYYSIKDEITIDEYHALPAREAAYYELKYKCEKDCTDDEGTTYHPKDPENENSKASTLTADAIATLFKNGTNTTGVLLENGEPNPEYWTENGVLPVYAGRPMNTIQRADFCGVFGCRMVMQGAQDRVPEIVNYTNYTINRVREVSLNKKLSVINGDPYTFHGNYFGIYNIVNYLGALTSDVDFGDAGNGGEEGDVGTGDVRTTDNSTSDTYEPDYEGQTFFGWKRKHIRDRIRNNGNSHNKVALASGVYLELTTELSTGTELREKDWGYITGVVELDLINVQTGIGGGFVYAKNVHGKRSRTNRTHLNIAALNANAVNHRQFSYSTYDDLKDEWQSSGNFVHSTQTIVDDCYNISGKYKGTAEQAVPAHYWYIKGFVYVYDQYISAYTGSPNAYSESVDIPLTITAASHGSMKLLNVQPNKYAYYKSNGIALDDDGKLIVNDVTYYKNDPVSYWDWHLLSAAEKALFVDETYVVTADCTIGNTEYHEGHSMLPSEYASLKQSAPKKDLTPDDDDDTTVPTVYHVEKQQDVDFDFVFRSSNNLSHETGYILTYKVNNPTEWNTWYTEQSDDANDEDIEREKNQTGGDGYHNGPTYRLDSKTGSVLGQRLYRENNIISQDVYNTYQAIVTDDSHKTALPTGQATFEPAYIVTENVNVTEGSSTRHLNPGAIVSETYMTDYGLSESTSPAYVCTSTIQLASTEYIYLDSKMPETDKQAYVDRVTADITAILPAAESATKMEELTSEAASLTAEQKRNLSQLLTTREAIRHNIVPAYYCTNPGLYGGNYYEAGKNYRGLEAWNSMSADDRKQFLFNYDALDLIIDPAFSGEEGKKWQYDGWNDDTNKAFATQTEASTNPAGYSLPQHVDYTASYEGSSALTLPAAVAVIGADEPKSSLSKGDELTRTVFEESIPNEQRHYTVIDVKDAGSYYVVNTSFQIGNSPYAVGATITADSYRSLTNADKKRVTKFEFTSGQANQKYYYCRESYTVRNDTYGTTVSGISVTATNGEGDDAESATVTGSFTAGKSVPTGLLINETTYNTLIDNNLQKNFTIHGVAPTETSTLYVSRNSDIFDLSKEKIITVIYQYDYEESDSHGNITPVSERHVVNIHLQFKSGIPFVEDIKMPSTVLPGDNVSLRDPVVTPGAYEIMGGGWEVFQNVEDAESHTNGVEFSPNFDPLYWYQHGYYVAYYAKTYLGKTYSNAVQFSVANYHDIDRVMQDTEHHMYVDNPDVKRNSKIYIDNRTCVSDPEKSELDLFSDLFTLSTVSTGSASGDLAGHALLNSRVSGCANLDFILNSDVSPKAYTRGWTPVGTAANCFAGWLHGNGFTVSGLDHSLFGHLCGNIYNVGVTGTFTSGGIADSGSGHIENTWVSTTATPTGKPIIDDTSDNPVVYNSYYPEEQQWTAHTVSATGNPDIIGRPMADFVNGQVAYLLNSNYLQARYLLFGQKSNNSTGTEVQRPVFFSYPDGTIEQETENGETQNVEHTLRYTNSTTDWPWHSGNGFVEDYMGSGDFRYSDGIIPKEHDVSYTGTELFIPVFPDDYLYFGQTLSYNLYGSTDRPAHDLHPTGIVKDHTTQSGDDVDNSRHLLLTLDTKTANRVFRAPAYFRNGEPGKSVIFNASAAFAGSYESYKPHEGLTAIDLTGGNGDITGYSGVAPGTTGDYEPRAKGYRPLLDYYGLTAIKTEGITRNLLAYAPTADAITGDATAGRDKAQATATATLGVLAGYFNDPAYRETDDAYRTVDAVKEIDLPKGHLVQRSDTYTATLDHLLVDRQDFNAPFAYSFDDSHRMWHQRTPDNYVNRTAGWEGISLPFSAELVTTDVKGEITHFYGGSQASKNDTGKKIGHEYWLREFKGIGGTADSEGTEDPVVSATMDYPAATTAAFEGLPRDKAYTNTFLWDYYYENSTMARHDANADTYQEYYRTGHTNENYGYAQAATPYIIGFPGPTYYEFDLSGQWTASNTATPAPRKLEQQTITFASQEGASIGVSDHETGVTDDGYTFRPNYLNWSYAADGTMPAGFASGAAFTLNAEGSSYDKLTTGDAGATIAHAFRPYFVNTETGSGSRQQTRSIVFTQTNDDDRQPEPRLPGYLSARPGRHKIVISSALETAADVRIVNTSGQTIASVTVGPGQTVEVPMLYGGVYIVQSADGHFTCKLAVK